MNRHQDWLLQAENDLQWAAHSARGGFFAQAAFGAQQAAEKTLKAYCFFKGFDIVRTHSLFQMMRLLGENGRLETCARELDIYYISGRYPDAFPAGAPCELITEGQAERAQAAAQEIHDLLKARISAA